MRRKLLVLGALLAVRGASAQTIAPQNPEEQKPFLEMKRLYREGNERFKEDHLEEALVKFRDARAAYPKASNPLYSEARAEHLLKRPLDAIAHYRAYIAETASETRPKELEHRESVRKWIDELSRQLSQITIDAPAGALVTVDGKSVDATAGPVDVLPAKHTIAATWKGKSEKNELSTKPGEPVRVALFEASRNGSPPEAVPPKAASLLAVRSDPTVPSPEEPSHGTWSSGRKVAMGLGVGGVVVAGVGIIFGLKSRNAVDDAASLRASIPRSACTSAVSLYAGFSCTDWSYTGTKAKVSPTDAGYALSVANAASAISVEDLELTSQPGTAASPNSIAAFVSKSSGVAFRRMIFHAGTGSDSANAAAPGTNLFSADINALLGKPAVGTTGGPKLDCACKTYGTSSGGKAGNAGIPAQNGDPGTATPMPGVMGARDSSGGAGYTSVNGTCTGGHAGADGLARNGGAGAASLGTLDETGWAPKAGAAGDAANPGGGGGGGGGGLAGGSGGGGCGGCGGAGGGGGKGGGASIALLAFNSPVTLEASQLFATTAGKGGNGSTGEIGGGGGGGNAGACGGGFGGNGAGGGGGGGGAGGVSAGVGYVGTSPTVDGATTTMVGAAGIAGGLGAAGNGGTNALSTAPAGAPGTAGHVGASAAVQSLAP